MRTTIEIKDELRARLLELAALRGLKGFSVLVEEAIERYLEEHDPHAEKVKAALSVLSTLDAHETEGLDQAIQRVRGDGR